MPRASAAPGGTAGSASGTWPPSRCAAPTAAAAVRVVPLTAARKAIAARMVESRRTTAPVTLTAVADATNLVNLREQFKAVPEAAGGAVPSYNDFLVKLVGFALRQHPHLAARWGDDGLILADRIDIGLAVDADAGLARAGRPGRAGPGPAAARRPLPRADRPGPPRPTEFPRHAGRRASR